MENLQALKLPSGKTAQERCIRRTAKVGKLAWITGEAVKHVFLAGISLVMAFPFLWMVISALKTKAEVMNTEIFLPQEAQWGNFAEVIFHSPILRYMGNSLLVSAAIVLLQVVTGGMMAYALSFMRFRGRKALFLVVVGTYMLPPAATYIPGYIILSQLNLLDSLTGLTISCTVNIFGIFLLRQAFMQLPYGLVEAAKVDGARPWYILWNIVFPLTRPTFITFILMSFITSYNSYMWPSLITETPDKALISQGLRMFFIEGGAYGTEWPKVMAASAVIVIPLLLLFLFTQKWFIKGISDTGMKG
ncbi:carbohydrate ABC transporter permease [Lactonifactor longoviformis]|uniref:carbohydrate ABC transporter permease n=1 Tax=Lactonifactor TaxID=420345 RepID=UPI0012AF0647|nr:MULTISPECIES: carbohydrate ABC transporter permease [Lactonifactor]MCQ4670795.1 carbohydrate ABC transporter permease [Lactonifactor longoviformis]MSA00575.1 ABC transporter permease subunit [Lactonifactor sp. BIOML-A5]MSA06543.1 ABC transporter permease subunit [Lactonifactor sp. BIOML-A4]MSA11217.1 ABC transporter permease subunit [Lactonifactor sp. BIOML-A3]MSA15775.1 ABC transporter permease subunit [Lactonifactor sp. BIOML-A2]